jgi:hypothetical protein
MTEYNAERSLNWAVTSNYISLRYGIVIIVVVIIIIIIIIISGTKRTA